MDISRQSATKILSSATNNKVQAFQLSNLSTPTDKNIALKEFIRNVEGHTKRGTATIILIRD